jgi:hypothetical protein
MRSWRFSHILNIVANFSLIAIAVGFVLIWVQLRKPSSQSQRIRLQQQLNIGSQVALPVDFGPSEKALLIGIRNGCHFCDEEQPFYQKLIAASKRKNVKIVFLLPDDPTLETDYIRSNNLQNSTVQKSDFSLLHILGTPTILLVGKDHKLRSYWIGKLSPDGESEVLASVNQNS